MHGSEVRTQIQLQRSNISLAKNPQITRLNTFDCANGYLVTEDDRAGGRLWLGHRSNGSYIGHRHATLDLFRPHRRITARTAGWRNNRHIARLGRWCANFRVNSCGRAKHAVGSRQLVAERLGARIGGRGALRRDIALLRHRLRGRATRRIPGGRWRALAGLFEQVASLA
jgi:hypothetical protein